MVILVYVATPLYHFEVLHLFPLDGCRGNPPVHLRRCKFLLESFQIHLQHGLQALVILFLVEQI